MQNTTFKRPPLCGDTFQRGGPVHLRGSRSCGGAMRPSQGHCATLVADGQHTEVLRRQDLGKRGGHPSNRCAPKRLASYVRERLQMNIASVRAHPSDSASIPMRPAVRRPRSHRHNRFRIQHGMLDPSNSPRPESPRMGLVRANSRGLTWSTPPPNPSTSLKCGPNRP